MPNDIATKTDALPATQTDQTFDLLQKAVASGTSPESLEKLVALQERILARNAEGEYATALAQFQARCPAIVKRKTVKDRGGRLLYAYAPLEDIIDQVKELLSELGLSYSFNTEHQDAGILVTCVIRHRAGHQEPSTVFVPLTKGHNTNASQDMAIQLTYGKRYTFIGALGIVTADEDEDGQIQKLKPISFEEAVELRERLSAAGGDEAKFLRYMASESFETIPQRDYERAVAAIKAKESNS